MRESTIEQYVRKYAEANGFLVFKLYGTHDPDRLFITPKGRVFFIEFKAPGKKPRLGQQIRIDEIKTKGHRVFVVDDSRDGRAIIDTMREETNE
jgi:hypothetical protein